MVARLDDIRSQRADRQESYESWERSGKEDEAAFREAGLGDWGGPAAEVGARIRASSIHAALLGALDDWQEGERFATRKTWPHGKWLQDVALEADPAQQAWRDRVRDQKVWNNAGAMKQIAKDALESNGSVGALVLLGNRLRDLSGEDGISALKQAQLKYPGDFWANIAVGDALSAKGNALRPQAEQDTQYYLEAVRYYQTAVGLHPNSPTAYNKLAGALAYCGRMDEAKNYFQEAIRFAPDAGGIRRHFGLTLESLGRRDEAFQQYKLALESGSKDIFIFLRLADSLRQEARYAEALDYMQHAMRLNDQDHAVQALTR